MHIVWPFWNSYVMSVERMLLCSVADIWILKATTTKMLDWNPIYINDNFSKVVQGDFLLLLFPPFFCCRFSRIWVEKSAPYTAFQLVVILVWQIESFKGLSISSLRYLLEDPYPDFDRQTASYLTWFSTSNLNNHFHFS